MALGKKANLEEAPTDEELDLASKQIAVEGQATDLALRKGVAIGALVLMCVQVAIADGVFVWYGDTNGWHIQPGVISAWLGATVIQIVSVVLVIVNYLFPRSRD